ncbi:hypothetical protein SLNSH_02455 [Alsobacter soli]|uniref:Uncharacterized protein n=1 Tax=Alsobacter soli TaxID=2109933 RepID=A0A2T1HYD4_9HYPH|nr:hypothetical protein [Alsobacter soli]PSC06681.1 hypothetical protein SLNSH_02455 [Alsobacter soli]
MLERDWRSRFLKRIVRHVDETAERQKQITAAKQAHAEVPLRAAHEHARLFPYGLVEKKEEAEARRGAMGRFPNKANTAPAKPAETKQNGLIRRPPPAEKPTRQTSWQWTRPKGP